MAYLVYPHLLSSLLRASSFFYAHLQHDQDFPSDTRPRDDLAPRLAPSHVLAAYLLELHLTINKLPMAAPVMASSNFHTSPMVIRIIHIYHCRVQYFSLEPWGIVTSAGGYIHWRRSSHLNSTSAHHKLAVSPIQPPDISRTNCNAIVDFDAIQGPSWMPESNLNSTSAHHKPTVSPIQPPDISRTNCDAIVDFDAIQGLSLMPESNYSFDVTDDPSCPQWHVRASPTIPNQPHDFPLSLSDQYPGEWRVPQEPFNISHSPQQEFHEFKFQRPLLNQAPTAPVVSSIVWKTMHLISMSQMTGSISPLFHVIQDDWFHFLE